jgi:hypothetical protein
MIVLYPGVGIVRLRTLGDFVSGKNVGYCEEARIGHPQGGRVLLADVFFERYRCAISVIAVAACADFPSSVEDDPAVIVFAIPKAGRLSFAARHVG